MFVEIFDSFNEVHKASFISALNFLLVILVSWGCMKALRKGVQTRIIAIPFGLALIPFTILGILEFFKGNRDYFGLVILIISPVLVYFGTASKLGDVQIQIKKENKRLEAMTSRERLIRNILIYGFLIAVMFLCAPLPMIIL